MQNRIDQYNAGLISKSELDAFIAAENMANDYKTYGYAQAGNGWFGDNELVLTINGKVA